MASTRRGAFIVLEGLDRSGKSTQCLKLVDNLNKAGLKAKSMRFPGVLRMSVYASSSRDNANLLCRTRWRKSIDRTTTTGKMIDAYLKQSADLDDHAIHLLFAVNRWEKA